MNDSALQRDPVEQLAEEFMERLRRGERPALSEYEAAHPDLADEIRDLFPALVMMEEIKPAGTEVPGPVGVGPDGPPERIGDYRIVREVARGGMGVVYEAEQVALGRHVALKVLPAQFDKDPLRLLRFRREARSAARLHHTNIVPVFDVGSAGGVHYYAMQFIQGQGLDEVLEELRRLRSGAKPTDAPADLTGSLAEGLRTGEFPAAPIVPVPRAATPRSESSTILTGSASHYLLSVARLGVQAAEALAYAHGQRVLHRDVKPSNLLLDRQGTLWLTDFGLAKDDGDDLTRTGDVVGTLRYMAPERFQGVSDPRTDVYALGVTLYELLTLRPAFPEQDRLLLIKQIAKDDPPRPRAIDPTIPRDLETIVLKAIEKEPGRRYQAAGDMAEDLRRFLADRPIKARRASWREQAWRWCRRNPGVAASLSAVFTLLVLLVVGLSVGTVLVWRAKREAEASLAEEKVAAYFQRIALAYRELATNNLPRAEAFLSLCPEELRRWEWHYLNRSRGRSPLVMRHQHPTSGKSALDPTGRQIATAGSTGLITIRDVASGDVVRTIPAHGCPCLLVAYSPDGRYLVSCDEPATPNTDGEVKVWDPRTGALLYRWAVRGGVVNALAVSPTDGLELATGTSRHNVVGSSVEIRDLTTGHIRRDLSGHSRDVQGLAFSPNGRWLASAGNDQVVRVSDRDTGRLLHEFRDPRPGSHPYWCVAFSPDGRHLAAGQGVEWERETGGARIWDMKTGVECAACAGHDVFSIAFAPDGRVATGGNDGTVRIWDPAHGQEVLTLRGFKSVVGSLAFTADGHRLVASDDRTVRVWDATPLAAGEHPGDAMFTLTEHTNAVKAVAFHPNTPQLVSGSADGTIRSWDGRSGYSRTRVLETGLDGVHALAFDPTGERLAIGIKKRPQPPDAPAHHRSGIVDARTGEFRVTFEMAPDENTHRLAFSPDGRFVAGCSMGAGTTIFVWDAGTGKVVRRLEGHRGFPYGIAFARIPTSGRVVLASVAVDGSVRIWNPETGALAATAFEHDLACAVAFSRDGRWLATAGWDHVVRVWDTATWKQVESIRDVMGRPNSVAFSPDGRLVAWGGTDSTVKVWCRGAEEPEVLRGHRNWVWDVAFSPDGTVIASAGRDGTVKVWKTPLFKK